MKTITQFLEALSDHNRALKQDWDYNCSMVTVAVHSGAGQRLTFETISTTDEDELFDAIYADIEKAAYTHAEGLECKKARLLAELEKVNEEIKG